MAQQERDFEARVSGLIAEFGKVAMSIVVVVGFFYVLLKWMQLKIDGGTNEVLTMMVGSLTTGFGLVLNFWLGSTSSASDSRRTQAALTDKLADAASASVPVTAPKPWWPLLTETERTAIMAAAGTDPKVKAFADRAAAGAGNSDDLAYVVGLGLLTQDRAAAIASTK